jgi:hypothetical protein
MKDTLSDIGYILLGALIGIGILEFLEFILNYIRQ